MGDTPGDLYGCENKCFARKGICKCMKMMEIKIDVGRQAGGGIRKIMKTKGGEKWVVSSRQ